MILDNSPYLVAFLITASIHMTWSTIPHTVHQQFSLLVSAPSSLGVNIIKLHMFALILLLSSLSFKTTSAISLSAPQLLHTYNVCTAHQRILVGHNLTILPPGLVR
jgi:hypothetical protein